MCVCGGGGGGGGGRGGGERKCDDTEREHRRGQFLFSYVGYLFTYIRPFSPLPYVASKISYNVTINNLSTQVARVTRV